MIHGIMGEHLGPREQPRPRTAGFDWRDASPSTTTSLGIVRSHAPVLHVMYVAEAALSVFLLLQRGPRERYDRQLSGSFVPRTAGEAQPRSSPILSSRATVKADNPSITFGEVGKKIGELWAKLSAAEKV